MSTLAHHGFIYVPLGYKMTFGLLAELGEVRGGSPWGAGTFAVSLSYTSLLYPYGHGFWRHWKLTTLACSPQTALASPPPRSSSSRRSRARPSTMPSTRSTSRDYMAAARTPPRRRVTVRQRAPAPKHKQQHLSQRKGSRRPRAFPSRRTAKPSPVLAGFRPNARYYKRKKVHVML